MNAYFYQVYEPAERSAVQVNPVVSSHFAQARWGWKIILFYPLTDISYEIYT